MVNREGGTALPETAKLVPDEEIAVRVHGATGRSYRDMSRTLSRGGRGRAVGLYLLLDDADFCRTLIARRSGSLDSSRWRELSPAPGR